MTKQGHQISLSAIGGAIFVVIMRRTAEPNRRTEIKLTNAEHSLND